MPSFDLIGFDGDDTLWHNEREYRMARDRFRDLLARSGVQSTEEEIDERVNQTELRNLRYYGYGVSSFVLSLIESSIELTEGRIPAADILEMLHLSKQMITSTVELFEGAEEVLARLGATYPLMLITKGDLLHQRSKVDQSGLGRYFRHIEVVSHKTEDTYTSILSRHAIEPSRFLMVGNSVRSDVAPVVRAGGWAVHIPAELGWSHEDGDLPEDGRDRCFTLDGLRQLPTLVEGLGGGRKNSGLKA